MTFCPLQGPLRKRSTKTLKVLSLFARKAMVMEILFKSASLDLGAVLYIYMSFQCSFISKARFLNKSLYLDSYIWLIDRCSLLLIQSISIYIFLIFLMPHVWTFSFSTEAANSSARSLIFVGIWCEVVTKWEYLSLCRSEISFLCVSFSVGMAS